MRANRPRTLWMRLRKVDGCILSSIKAPRRVQNKNSTLSWSIFSPFGYDMVGISSGVNFLSITVKNSLNVRPTHDISVGIKKEIIVTPYCATDCRGLRHGSSRITPRIAVYCATNRCGLRQRSLRIALKIVAGCAKDRCGLRRG